MKTILKKGFIIIVVIAIAMSLYLPNVMATDIFFDPDDYGGYDPTNPDEAGDAANHINQEREEANSAAGDALTTMADWGAGLLLYPLKLFILVIGKIIEGIINTFAPGSQAVTPETILFNKLDLVNINFFNSNSSEAFIQSLQSSIAGWYYGIRNIAIVASLAILIYVAIRMATSSVAEDKAKYKTMFTDWLISFALIFVLHYIIILIINLNDVLVKMIGTAIENNNASGNLSTYLKSLWEQSFNISLVTGFGSCIIYVILLFITLGFLIMYIKRLIVVAFLIIIAPLITITYALDKIGDGRAQALNTWIKEFLGNVLIQPFHCIIYLVFVSVSMGLLTQQNLASSVLAIMCMLFIMQAEDIVKKIFNIQSDDSGKLGSSAALAVGSVVALKNMKSLADNKNSGTKANAQPKVENTNANIKEKSTVGSSRPASAVEGESTDTKTTTQGAPKQSSRVQSAMDKFKNTMGNAVSSPVYDKIKDMTMNNFDRAMGTIGAIGATVQSGGDVGKIATGYFAGRAASEGLKALGSRFTAPFTSHANNVVQRRRIENAETEFTNGYNEYKDMKGFSKEQMERRVEAYVKLDLNSSFAKNMNEQERRFAELVQKMSSQYASRGDADTTESVRALLNRINLKDTTNE